MKKERIVRTSSEEKKVPIMHLERLKTYGAMVKANFVPKIDESKVKEMSDRAIEMNMPKSIIAQ